MLSFSGMWDEELVFISAIGNGYEGRIGSQNEAIHIVSQPLDSSVSLVNCLELKIGKQVIRQTALYLRRCEIMSLVACPHIDMCVTGSH